MTTEPSQSPMYSDFKGDPDMAELLEYFVEEMPERIASLEDCLESEDLERLKTITHQLKGAAPGYGWEGLGTAAGAIEQQLKAGLDDIRPITDEIRALVNLCERVAL